MPCPTVYFPQCSTTAPPRFGEKTTTSTIPCACTSSLLVSIKGGGRLSLKGVGPFGRTQRLALLTEHIRSSEPRYWHSPQSTPPLAETWELPSLSRTPLCWMYGPTAGTRINPCVTVLPLASTSGRGTRSIIT